MSKKMLKRGLALGALMAFVITGSAMANDVEYVGTKAYKLNDANGKNVVNLNVTIPSSDAIYGAKLSDGVVGLNELKIITQNGGLDIQGMDVTLNAQSITITNPNAYSALYNGNSKVGSIANINFETKLDINAGQGIVAGPGKQIIVKGTESNSSIEINTTRNGMRVWGGGNIDLEANNITVESDGNAIDDVKYVVDKENPTDEVNKANVVLNAGNDLAITGNINVAYWTGVELDAVATTVIEGDISVAGTSSVYAKFNGEKSSLTGSVTTNDIGVTSLTFNGAIWNVTDKSNVTTLAGSNANIVVSDLTPELVTIGTDSTEQLTVTADASVEGLEGDAETKLKKVINTIAITKDNVGDDSVNTAQITNDPIYEDLSANFDANGEFVGDVNKEIASANLSVNDMVAIGMMSWRAEMNDMNKRMGELRNANGEHGVWVRMVRGESEYNSVKNQYNQYQLGYDEKLSVDKRWTVGAAISYTDAENNFAEGTGESTNKAFSVYGSKLNDDGTFVDLIAKYARLDNDFKTLQGQGAAEYDTNAYSFSAEVGKRIQQGKGLWIEPQVELTYGKVSAVDYVTDKGVNVAQDGMESLVGRIGFSLGKDIEKGNVYARASYLYDFDGETKATLNNDAVLENDLGGGWWEVGVGANINLSKATYIYADIEKTFGGEVDTNWQWNLGVRYSF